MINANVFMYYLRKSFFLERFVDKVGLLTYRDMDRDPMSMKEKFSLWAGREEFVAFKFAPFC